MSASQAAKEAGLDSLAQAARLTGKPANTLHNWYRDSPRLFAIVMQGCAYQLKMKERIT